MRSGLAKRGVYLTGLLTFEARGRPLGHGSYIKMLLERVEEEKGNGREEKRLRLGERLQAPEAVELTYDGKIRTSPRRPVLRGEPDRGGTGRETDRAEPKEQTPGGKGIRRQ